MDDRGFRGTGSTLTILSFLVIIMFVGLVLFSFPLAKSFLVGVAIWVPITLIRRVGVEPCRDRIFTMTALGLIGLLILGLLGIGGLIFFTGLRGPATPTVVGELTPTPSVTMTPLSTPTPTPVPTQVRTDSFSAKHDLELELEDNTIISREAYVISSKDVAVEKIIFHKLVGELISDEGYSVEEDRTRLILTGEHATAFGPCAIAPGGQVVFRIQRRVNAERLGFLTRRAILPLLTNNIDLVFAGPTDKWKAQLSYFEVNAEVEFLLPRYSFLGGNPPPASQSIMVDEELVIWKISEEAPLAKRERTITVDYVDAPIRSELIRTVISRLTLPGVIDYTATVVVGLVGADTVLRWLRRLFDRIRGLAPKEESSTDAP